jgi:hypothetical protein
MSWTTGDEGRRLETICHVTKDADWRQYVMWRRTQTGDNMSCDEGHRLETICHVKTHNRTTQKQINKKRSNTDHTEAKINRSSFFSLNIEYTLWNGTLIYSGKEIYLINLMLFEYQSYIKRTSIIPDTEYVWDSMTVTDVLY